MYDFLVPPPGHLYADRLFRSADPLGPSIISQSAEAAAIRAMRYWETAQCDCTMLTK